MTLAATEFLRRFLLHILPKGFKRIRQYGLLANRHHGEKLAAARRLLSVPAKNPEPETAAPADLPKTTPCPSCGVGAMRVILELPSPFRRRLRLGAVLCDTS